MLIQNVIIKYDIFNSDIYNFEKIGFFIEMLNHAKVVITLNHKNKLRTKQFNNCEWVSIIQIVYANNYVLLPYMIMKRKCHFFFWY